MTTHYVEIIDQLNNPADAEFMAKSTEFANTYAEDPNALALIHALKCHRQASIDAAARRAFADALLATGAFEESAGIVVEKLREVDVPVDTVAGDMAAALVASSPLWSERTANMAAVKTMRGQPPRLRGGTRTSSRPRHLRSTGRVNQRFGRPDGQAHAGGHGAPDHVPHRHGRADVR